MSTRCHDASIYMLTYIYIYVYVYVHVQYQRKQAEYYKRIPKPTHKANENPLTLRKKPPRETGHPTHKKMNDALGFRFWAADD